MHVTCPFRLSKDPVEMGQDWAMLSLRVEMSPCHVAAWPCMAHCARWHKHSQQKGFGHVLTARSQSQEPSHPCVQARLWRSRPHRLSDRFSQSSWCKLTLETLWLCNQFFLPAGIHPEFIPFYFGTLPILEGTYVAMRCCCGKDVSWWEVLLKRGISMTHYESPMSPMEDCFPFHCQICQRKSAAIADCHPVSIVFQWHSSGKYFRRNFSPKFYGVWRLADRADRADPVNPNQFARKGVWMCLMWIFVWPVWAVVFFARCRAARFWSCVMRVERRGSRMSLGKKLGLTLLGQHYGRAYRSHWRHLGSNLRKPQVLSQGELGEDERIEKLVGWVQAGCILKIVMSINALDIISYIIILYHIIRYHSGGIAWPCFFMRYMMLHVERRLVFQARAISSIVCHVLSQMARVDNMRYLEYSHQKKKQKSTCLLDRFGTMTKAIPYNTTCTTHAIIAIHTLRIWDVQCAGHIGTGDRAYWYCRYHGISADHIPSKY